VLVLKVTRRRRGQLEYGQKAMFTSRGPISLDPGILLAANGYTAIMTKPEKNWTPLSRKLLLVFPVFFKILILHEYQHFLGVLFIVFSTKALDKIFQLYRLVREQKNQCIKKNI
jgi:hypothetical protein